MSFLDGLLFDWLIDRNSDEARAAIDVFAGCLATLARPRETHTAASVVNGTKPATG